LKTDDQLLIT